jgi:hypothetical protein
MMLYLPKNVSDRAAVNIGIILSTIACLAILLLGTWLLQFELAVQPAGDVGFFYEWQLANPTFLTRATAWLGFGFHQLLIWLTIWWAIEKSPRTYSNTLRPVNLVALGINALFIVLHYLQTMFFYDGIAQDLPSWTAQGTVIMMLFIILAMENRRRGLFFGKKVTFRQEFYRWLRDYHGYAFSFAIIYTFWFHPMVPTIGHLLGFLQVMFILVQGSLMFTKIHVNKTWIVLLELIVLPHAALVAVNQGGNIVYMFALGFLVMFIVSQMHAFNLKPWMKYMIYGAFLITLFIIYVIGRPFFMINEIIRIPAILYGMVFITYGGWWLYAKARGIIKNSPVDTKQPAPLSSGD